MQIQEIKQKNNLQSKLLPESEMEIETTYERGNHHLKNKLNNLTGKEWLFFTKTIFKTSYAHEYAHELRKEHFANKPPQLMEHLIKFFTKEKQTVLDPFAGVGGTLLGASLCNRRATGIELNEKWIEIYKKICKKESIKGQEIIRGDCLEIMKNMIDENRTFHSVITDPPYSPALKKTLCDEKYDRANRKSNFNNFSESRKDFRNSESFEEYYQLIKKAGELIYQLLDEGKYLVMMIRDSYQNEEYIPASFYISERLKQVGFIFKGVKIWYSTGAPIRPYGYPYQYVPNIVHHNILIFKK